ncbi:pirin family protein [Mucilaginibacter gilvus]|nr:pirin family protein [Mucilaginibacter gilvus]
MIIEERPRLIGNFLVGRLLPFKDKKMVGPFIFLDHLGPVSLPAGENLDIGPHPHIGLSTLSYLLEGSVLHHDSLGNKITISPGQVNWMTAGRGIVHSERTPPELRTGSKNMHGLQIWVALPKELEEMDPAFSHTEEAELPQWEIEKVKYKLLAGTIMGHRSPVPVYSRLFLLEITCDERCLLDLSRQLYGECGIYILRGSIEAEGKTFGNKELLIINDIKSCGFTATAGTTVFFFGGEPFPEERHIYWNFVASDYALIEKAKNRWRQNEFSPIAGEDDNIPMPLENANIKYRPRA